MALLSPVEVRIPVCCGPTKTLHAMEKFHATREKCIGWDRANKTCHRRQIDWSRASGQYRLRPIDSRYNLRRFTCRQERCAFSCVVPSAPV
jgi:hypothetical protein